MTNVKHVCIVQYSTLVTVKNYVTETTSGTIPCLAKNIMIISILISLYQYRQSQNAQVDMEPYGM